MRGLTSIGALSALFILLVASPTHAVKIGVLGDSLSDEYFEASYGSYSDNWTVQLVNYRGIDLGPTGVWGEPRRNGYEYNWARSGATTASLLSSGQHTGLAAQVLPQALDYAVMMIGTNDQVIGFPGSSAYEGIYDGTWTSTQISTWVSGVVNNIDTALSAVVPTGVKTVLVGPIDYGHFPVTQGIVPIAAGRQAVHDVLANQLNPQIEALAQTYNLSYVDFLGALDAIFGPHNSLNSTLTIGNVNIQLQVSDNVSGTDLTAAFVDDQLHAHTTIQGLVANLVMEGLNIGYGANLSLFTEQEILAHRGIVYGGSDTLQAQIGNFSDYVTNYVPEPSSLVLAGLAGVALAIVTLRRRKAA